MTGLLKAELLKLRTARVTLGMTAGMVALVCLVVVVHALALPAEDTMRRDEMRVFGWGQLGALFGSLLGAASITSEIRNGTIRPVFLATPRRSRVLVAKVVVAVVAGVAYGAAAGALTLGLGSAILAARGMPIRLDGGDFAQLFVGSAIAAALWAPLGLGLGALMRGQVGTLVGLCTWWLVVESVFLGLIPDIVRYFPGAAAAAIAGATVTGEIPTDPTLVAPIAGAALLATYAAAAVLAGIVATERRDVP